MSKVLNIDDLLITDDLGCNISNKYLDWEIKRAAKVQQWKEIQQYIFATDTTQTTNSKLPWSNKTTVPKLCQIRDNLHANYMAAMFPRNKWLVWEGGTEEDNSIDKKDTIESYMRWVVDRNEYREVVSQLVYDYIDYGNFFGMPEWVDQTILGEDQAQTGFVGPAIQRIAPPDIVFDPTAPTFVSTPKIVRSLVSLGEVKKILEKQSADEDEKVIAQEIYKYLRDVRIQVAAHNGSFTVKDQIYNVAGFDNFQAYLTSNMCEILTFYGDLYEFGEDKLYNNVVIKIIDRHKVIYNKPNPSIFGYAPIFHSGWRLRPDNLWAQGPLDNLVGMQYRIDHLENMKADCFDLIAYPPLKVTGYVEDFTWAPMERILVGDDGNVEMLSPDPMVLQADNQIAILEAKMEEYAGAPKEAMGFRTPGEKTMYEVQSLENAASRIFQNKITQFEQNGTENFLNSMLELSRRNITDQTISVFDDEYKITTFLSLTNADLTGVGRLKPMAARHFAEKANLVQNLTQFFQTAGADPSVSLHFSSVKLAKIWEELLDIKDYKVVQPFVRLEEQADAAKLQGAYEENVLMERQTPTGIMPGDFDPDALQASAEPTGEDETSS